MLVFTRKQDDSVVIDGRLVVRIFRVTGNRVSLGLEGQARFVRSEVTPAAVGGDRNGHLVLRRKAGEGIDIVGLGTVKVTRIRGKRATLGFEGFPQEVRIVRGELLS